MKGNFYEWTNKGQLIIWGIINCNRGRDGAIKVLLFSDLPDSLERI